MDVEEPLYVANCYNPGPTIRRYRTLLEFWLSVFPDARHFWDCCARQGNERYCGTGGVGGGVVLTKTELVITLYRDPEAVDEDNSGELDQDRALLPWPPV